MGCVRPGARSVCLSLRSVYSEERVAAALCIQGRCLDVQRCSTQGTGTTENLLATRSPAWASLCPEMSRLAQAPLQPVGVSGQSCMETGGLHCGPRSPACHQLSSRALRICLVRSRAAVCRDGIILRATRWFVFPRVSSQGCKSNIAVIPLRTCMVVIAF